MVAEIVVVVSPLGVLALLSVLTSLVVLVRPLRVQQDMGLELQRLVRQRQVEVSVVSLVVLVR